MGECPLFSKRAFSFFNDYAGGDKDSLLQKNRKQLWHKLFYYRGVGQQGHCSWIEMITTHDSFLCKIGQNEIRKGQHR